MHRNRLRNILILALWLVVATGFLGSILAAGGPDDYAESILRRAVGAGFLAIGLLGSPLVRLITRSRDRIERDERDEQNELKAVNGGLIVIVMAIFLLSLWLWESCRESGCVPVGWLWIMAYGSLILSHLAPASITLWLDMAATRGEG